MDESNTSYLIEKLKNEKNKYVQEIIANRIGQFKSEHTAKLAAKMLEVDDTRIRNTAIEILQDIGEISISAISELIYHKDKNIRKFALDIAKEIKAEKSSLLAMAALKDKDDNIIQTAIEVLGNHKYLPALPLLIEVLNTTSNIWILQAIINTFAVFKECSVTDHIEKRLKEISLTTFNKNILVNSYIKALGDIGSIVHLEQVMMKYKEEYQIDDDNLQYCLNGIIVRNRVEDESFELIKLIQSYYEEKLNIENPKLSLDTVSSAIKLGFIFMLKDLKLLKILIVKACREDYCENLLEIVVNQSEISEDIVRELLIDKDDEVKIFALRMIRRRRIEGLNEIVRSLCFASPDSVCAEALKLIVELESYYDKNILYGFVNNNNYELSKVAVQGIRIQETRDIKLLVKTLRSSNRDIRKTAMKKLMENNGLIDINDILEIVKDFRDSTIVEALELLIMLDSKKAEELIGKTLDTEDREVRKRIVKIIEIIQNDDFFYKYMCILGQDCDGEVRRTVIKEISKKEGYKSFILLKTLLESENIIQNKYEILCNLYKYKFEDCYRLLVQNLSSRDVLLKIAAVTSLGLYGDKRVVKYLEKLIMDEELDVVECAKEALSRLEVVK
jgi:HEAT repeat protein